MEKSVLRDEETLIYLATFHHLEAVANDCLLYTSDAADEGSSVYLGGRRILKKKTTDSKGSRAHKTKE